MKYLIDNQKYHINHEINVFKNYLVKNFYSKSLLTKKEVIQSTLTTIDCAQ